MPISEAARNDLYTGLAQVLGQDRAETLMSAISLNDLDQVKSDIASIRGNLGTLETAIQRVDEKLDRLTFVLITGLFAVVATLIGVGVLA